MGTVATGQSHAWVEAWFAGLGWIPAIMLGMITAVGGGAVRDICIGRVPGIASTSLTICGEAWARSMMMS